MTTKNELVLENTQLRALLATTMRESDAKLFAAHAERSKWERRFRELQSRVNSAPVSSFAERCAAAKAQAIATGKSVGVIA